MKIRIRWNTTMVPDLDIDRTGEVVVSLRGLAKCKLGGLGRKGNKEKQGRDKSGSESGLVEKIFS